MYKQTIFLCLIIIFLPCKDTFVHVGRNLQVGFHSLHYPKDSFDPQLFSEQVDNQLKQSYNFFFSNDTSFLEFNLVHLCIKFNSVVEFLDGG